MKPLRHHQKWLQLALTGLCLISLGSCARADDKPIDFELTGRALDKDTKEPIEGAYAVAIYEILLSGPAATVSRCVKTKGMYTGKDGKFHFPVDKRDGYSPNEVVVMHLDYVLGHAEEKPDAIRRLQNAEAYADRNAYMKKMDPQAPRYFQNEHVECLYAKTKEDAAASIDYFKIVKAQAIKYKRTIDFPHILESMDKRIRRLETIDGRAPNEIIEEPVKPKF